MEARALSWALLMLVPEPMLALLNLLVPPWPVTTMVAVGWPSVASKARVSASARNTPSRVSVCPPLLMVTV